MVPDTMAAMQLTGHGGIDALVYREDLPVPRPAAGEVLIEVTATAKNNTDRKVREGRYPVEDDADVASFAIGGTPTLHFPRIQGADVVGRVVAVGAGVDAARIGQRGLLDFNLYADDRDHINLAPDYYGHGRDGGFAEYMTAASEAFHAVDDPALADAELATLGMCSWQTALHMLRVAKVRAGEQVLVTGASGGVGTALLQLCRLLGARPHALSSPGKAEALKVLGAASVIDRTAPGTLAEKVDAATGGVIIDAVMDLVGGRLTPELVALMTRRMGERSSYPRLSIAGAGAGNVSQILWTRIYLYQVQIFGVSHGSRAEAGELIDWIRNGDLRPVLHGAFPLSALHRAERYFAERGNDFIGKIVIVPDARWAEHGARFAL